jgi:hypothetical protein
MCDILGLSAPYEVSARARKHWAEVLVVSPDPSFGSVVCSFVLLTSMCALPSRAHMQCQSLACAQEAKRCAEAGWQKQQPGDSEAIAKLKNAVANDEHMQSKMGGLPVEVKIKAAHTGSTPALLILIKHVQDLLAMVMPRTFSEPVS